METSKLKNLKILTSHISLNHLSLQKWHISPYLKDSTFPFLEGNSETSPPKDKCPSGCFFNLLLDTRPVTRVKLHHRTALDVLKLIREAKDHSLKNFKHGMIASVGVERVELDSEFAWSKRLFTLAPELFVRWVLYLHHTLISPSSLFSPTLP